MQSSASVLHLDGVTHKTTGIASGHGQGLGEVLLDGITR